MLRYNLRKVVCLHCKVSCTKGNAVLIRENKNRYFLCLACHARRLNNLDNFNRKG